MPNSYKDYTGNGSTTTFSITFDYQKQSEISVTVDGVAQSGFTFPSSTQVQLSSAPAASTQVRIRRTTDLTSREVDFTSGSVLTEEDLDNSNIQVFHAVQEAVDTTSDSIALDDDDKFDAKSKIVKNVANPTSAQDAVTKDYLENTWLTTSDKAQLNSLNLTNLNTVATNIVDVNSFANTYFISGSTPSSPTAGDIWYDTSTNTVKIYNGSSFLPLGQLIGGSLKLADNEQAIFGASEDLKIYHDGNHSFILDQGTGYLYLFSDGPGVGIMSSTSETMALFTPNGAATLYYDNSAKIATTAAGIDVTGTVTDDGATHDGDVTFTGANYNAVWDKSEDRLVFADNAKVVFGASADLQIHHDGNNSYIRDTGQGDLFIQASNNHYLQFANGDYALATTENGGVEIRYDNNTKLETTSAGINVTGNVQLSGGLSVGGDLGTSGQILSSTGSGLQWITDSGGGGGGGTDFEGGVVINDNSADVDFRVESNNNENMLFVDGGNDRVAIGHNAPLGDLHIKSGAASAATPNSEAHELVLEAGGNGGMTIATPNATGVGSLYFANADSSAAGRIRYYNQHDMMVFFANDAEAFRIYDSVAWFNGGQRDVDFRVDHDSGIGLFMRGSDSKVAIGHNAPAGQLHVKSGASGGASINGSADELVVEGSASGGLTILTPNSSNGNIMFADPDDNDVGGIVYQHGANAMTFKANTNEFLRGYGTSVVVNEFSNDMDFRVESNNNANMLFVDGGNDRVGIGTNAPGQPLEIFSTTAEVSLNSSSSTYSRFVHKHNGTAMWTTGTRAATDYHIFRESGSGSVVIDSGTLNLGGNDAGSAGLLSLYGGATGEGGEIRIHPSAAEDTTVDHWSIDVATDDLRVFNSLGDLALSTIANGSVDLYHDGGHKFSTTASGIALNGGQTSQISIKSTGGSGFTQGAIVIEGHASEGTPGNRGQGVYYFNEGNDRTYYSGTFYNNGTVWGVGTASSTSLAAAAADTTNAIFAVDGVNQRVGIKQASPSTELDVNGTVKISGGLNAGGGLGSSGQVLTSTGTGINWTNPTSAGITASNAADNRVAVFSSSTNIEGDADLTWNGLTLAVAGAISKNSGSFKIDHPLPAKSDTHHLVHSFLEGPQADLIYRGKIDLVDGSATVNINTAAGMTDGTFVALCTDVQCFTSNESGWTAVKGAVSGNTLTITAQDNTCTDTISWMVVGERKDAHMFATDWTDDNGKVIVEPLKPVI